MKKLLTHIIFLFIALGINAKVVKIKRVEPIVVTTPQTTVPRLPHMVWVKYNNGKGEWRQAKWMNFSKEDEMSLADPSINPSGTTYTVKGFIVGDDATPQGYPIEAKVNVTSDNYATPSHCPKASPIPLNSVMLQGDNLLVRNRSLDVQNLLKLDVSQQLYNYRATYGLSTDGYKVSDGWDSPTTKLKGHGTGHYMSALAFAYATESDPEIKQQIYTRIERMVRELRECQERTFVFDDSLGRYREARDYAPESVLAKMKGTWKDFDDYAKDYRNYGYGYLNAIPAAHPALIECYRQYNNEEWVWAPYYSIHKQLAGLIDIATLLPSSPLADKALLIAKDMGLWVWNRMHYRTFSDPDDKSSKPGNRARMWNMYIAGEVGGMAESLARLAQLEDRDDDRSRLLEAAQCFDAPILFGNVARNIDDVRTRHANQHIPMFVGALQTYICNDDPFYYNLALNFWLMMQGRYVYATGGVGNGEMWRQPYSQIASMNTNYMSDNLGNRHPNPTLNETCCAYNLAKLTKDLNRFNPDDASFMDYYERVLYNQIVGSLNPDQYGVCYHYAVGLNAAKPFGNETPQSSCCGGTGAENHLKYQEAAYFANDTTLWVALYLPTKASFSMGAKNAVTINQQCGWPAESSVIRLTSESPVSVKLRVPYWATRDFCIKLNGVAVRKTFEPSSYVEIPARVWNENDKIEVIMPFSTHIYYGMDKMDLALVEQTSTPTVSAHTSAVMTPFAPQWVGTLMRGPLVMTSPDIHNWDEAVLTSEILAGIESGNTASLPRFVPDYAVTSASTHYLRIPSSSKKNDEVGVDMQQKQQLITEAEHRIADKSSWAPYGFERMQQALSELKSSAKTDNQSLLVSRLNVALLTMRPSTLAEPEDLTELRNLMSSSKDRNALRYATMVVRYVNDGSGTKDMIEKAIKMLKP